VTIARFQQEVSMSNELTDRQLAIQLRMSGEAIDAICQRLERPPSWFHKWWRRYLLEGAEGLYDLARAPHSFLERLSPQVERLIVSVRRRLAAHASPETRYQRIGAPTIQVELQGLRVTPLPSVRTIERVVSQHGLTSPRLRMARPLNPNGYPTPSAEDSNALHQIDLVGPVYLKGQHQRWYIYVCKFCIYGTLICAAFSG
jgi:hypothetical protein